MRLLRGFLSVDDRVALGAVTGGFVAGRQGTGYEKLALRGDPAVDALVARSLAVLDVDAGSPFWDAYLLRYPTGAGVPAHVDVPEVTGVGHHRLNALVRAGDGGGVLSIGGVVVDLAVGDAVVFRPDVDEHAVTPVRAGERLVWSVGAWK